MAPAPTETDGLARAVRLVEQTMTLVVAAVLIWQLTPEPVKAEVRAQLEVWHREWLRAARVRRERRVLESEAWHVGQILNDYGRNGDAERFARALGFDGTDLPGRHPGLGET
jgi:methylphosphotriester-DNA--protein-cysteine methyltransferase